MSVVPLPIRPPAEQPHSSGDQSRARPDARGASREAQAFEEAVAEVRRSDPEAGLIGAARSGKTFPDESGPDRAAGPDGVEGETAEAVAQAQPNAPAINVMGGMPSYAPLGGFAAWEASRLGSGEDRLEARPNRVAGLAEPSDILPEGFAASVGLAAGPPLAKADFARERFALSVVRAESHLAPALSEPSRQILGTLDSPADAWNPTLMGMREADGDAERRNGSVFRPRTFDPIS